MRLDVRTIVLLLHPHVSRVLLLRRGAHKALFPGLITGIGGKVELDRGEGEDLDSAALRELVEETGIGPDQIDGLNLRLATSIVRGEELVVLLWFTAKLKAAIDAPPCTEGDLAWFDIDALPLDAMIPTAREAIPLVLSFAEDDSTAYCGVFDAGTMELHIRPR